jgi:hypothetical protein
MALVKKSAAAGDDSAIIGEQERASLRAELLKISNDNYRIGEMQWEAKKRVTAEVKQTGMKRWAYEIVALAEAGLYDKESHGYRLAKRQIDEDSGVMNEEMQMAA